MALTLEVGSSPIVSCSRQTTAGVFIAMGLKRKNYTSPIQVLGGFLKYLACDDSFFTAFKLV